MIEFHKILCRLVTCFLALSPFLQLDASQPNILLILADDLGLGDVGFHSLDKMKSQKSLTPNDELGRGDVGFHRQDKKKSLKSLTPNIDALAAEGLWFTDAHSPTSLCSPSRYALMSGRYTFRSNAPWGTWNSFSPTAFEQGDPTLGSVLKGAGYQTAFVGKWHLGGDFPTKDGAGIFRGRDRGDKSIANLDHRRWVGGGPASLGFDQDYTMPCGIQGPYYIAYENGVWSPFSEKSKFVMLDEKTAINAEDLSSKGSGMGDSHWNASEASERLTQKATAMIAKMDKNRPFFLYYCSPLVHEPHMPPAQLGGEAIAGTAPTHHLDMVRAFDWEVAQLVKALKQAGKFEDTLILITSDNGGLQDSEGQQAGCHSGGGFSGLKNAAFEGGHRVPLIAVWKNVIQAGVSHAMVNGTDILSTFADLTKAELPKRKELDSHSFADLLLGKSDFKPRQTLMSQAGSRYELMYREGNLKIIMESNANLSKCSLVRMYNLEKDINEKNNLLKQPEMKEKALQMLKTFISLRGKEGKWRAEL